ncbi:zonular occludens toxin family protein [Cellvibrio sp. OA-2007]|uniref:zonular occludens toxin family protein n=1 Tax=Cellvibrio sp. OA-2007 TaxID=529823 RepID=UPI0007855074|nr:zonular occludens toxin domain-containing protein [Cellvibrio sp. OA-2007]
MSTAIIHGDPGSYKTSALVSDYLVPAVKSGRVVVTNIRGVKTPEEIAEIYSFVLPDTAEIILVEFTEAGFEKMARFFHWVPEGALILMDEGQRVYPTRLRDFKCYDLHNPQDEKRPRTVEDAFDSHRHMNWDIYISTPNIGKIHKEIRSVAEFGYRHKNMATVFSFMRGRYKRVTHIADNSGTAMGHAISASLKKIDKRAFDVYQSTATGKTKDSSASFSFFKQPKVLLVLCIIGYSVWNMGSTVYSAGGLPTMFGGSVKPSDYNPNKAPAAAPVQASAGLSSSPVSNGVSSPNPFGGLVIYMVGDVAPVGMLFQVEFPDKSYISMTQLELEQLGFNIAKINTRMAKVTFDNEVFYALPKPVAHYVADSPNTVQPDLNLIN